MAGDVYANRLHDGRGGWTWYTGSAGWMYRAGLESILGLRRSGSDLRDRPLHSVGVEANTPSRGESARPATKSKSPTPIEPATALPRPCWMGPRSIPAPYPSTGWRHALAADHARRGETRDTGRGRATEAREHHRIDTGDPSLAWHECCDYPAHPWRLACCGHPSSHFSFSGVSRSLLPSRSAASFISCRFWPPSSRSWGRSGSAR